ncbi:MAG: bifunctional phosphoribosyl-AMP cyclohydrolase/phosphoribosyl-ATP diphosphatase HisIE [Flavobacteriaceae bacterium TMED42]|nr:MAG: bifunctional phosphoribosyl-AMP cyclohydrolase/phosphoribosyl-ATP diphosphatase HisIE [Flavobacteriaceae bacterium TMED42]|tara:strand:- start:3578 stop:4177 length:600 start_codon:yes stop_codon:yes gene_type:complete
MKTANFNKNNEGLLPAIVQDEQTRNVMMLGYMNEEALKKTQSSGKVTFFSRSKQRLWTKGEESGNFLLFKSYKVDCDQDTLLVMATPLGPTCHQGTDTCWGEENSNGLAYIKELEAVIEERKNNPSKDSYVSSLFEKGINKIAQKVGEESVETVIEAIANNEPLFMEEAADLFFHYLILLKSKGKSLEDVLGVLEERKR